MNNIQKVGKEKRCISGNGKNLNKKKNDGKNGRIPAFGGKSHV